MKNFTKTTFLIVLLAFAFGGCAPKTSKTIVNNNKGGSGSNPITDTDGDGVDDSETGSGSIEGCNGIYRAGATDCYYANLPEVIISGPGVGAVYWSSTSSSVDQNQFMTDRVFGVRFQATTIPGGKKSAVYNKVCSNWTSNSFSKLKVKVMLRKASQSMSDNIVTLEADLATSTVSGKGFSPKKYFTVPKGNTEPFVLEIVEVQSDHSCKQANGSLYCPYAAIPVNQGGPTECVGVRLEIATDSTYDLPKN